MCIRDSVGSYPDGRSFLYVIWKNYPTSLLRRHAGDILRAQAAISYEALRAWRGAAARARLRGQLVGFVGLARLWPARRRIQAARRINDRLLAARLTPVDATAAGE